MHLVTLVAACLIIAGCGAASQRRPGTAAPAGLRWTGTFPPTVSRSGGIEARGTHKTTGQIVLMESRNPERMSVSLSLSAPGHESRTLTWAVLPGACGSASFPVASYQQFPVIEVGSNGRAELSVELAMRLEVTTSYHANVYSGGVQLSNVVTCTNLRLM